MVVRQRAAIDAGYREHRQVGRMHPVIHRLRPEISAGGGAGLEIDDARGRRGRAQDRQCVAPDVVEADVAADRTVRALGQAHVCLGGAHVGFPQQRIDRVRQDLVNAASEHDIATEKQPDAAEARPGRTAACLPGRVPAPMLGAAASTLLRLRVQGRSSRPRDRGVVGIGPNRRTVAGVRWRYCVQRRTQGTALSPARTPHRLRRITVEGCPERLEPRPARPARPPGRVPYLVGFE